MSKNIVRTAAWWCILAFTVGAAVFVYAFRPPQGVPDYDYVASIKKLERIGAALQVYRTNHAPKPVAQRSDANSAGLPSSIVHLCEKGKPWTVSEGMSAFQVKQFGRLYSATGCHFQMLYWPSKLTAQLGDLGVYLRERGEELPILADLNMNTIEEMSGPNDQLKAVVLRLNGKVEVVTWDNMKPNDLFAK
jgi:hypothetical protein